MDIYIYTFNFNSSAFLDHDNVILYMYTNIAFLSGLIVIKLANMIIFDNGGGHFVFQPQKQILKGVNNTRMILRRECSEINQP